MTHEIDIDIQKLMSQPMKIKEVIEELHEKFPRETGRAVHFAVNGKHLDEEMMEEAFTTITRYDGARAPFWTMHDFEELLSKSNISITGQQYNKYDVNFLAQYYAADFKSLGQDPMTFICMAIDRLHDVDDPKAAEKAYRTAAHRIATKH